MLARAVETERRQCVDMDVDLADALLQDVEKIERRDLARSELYDDRAGALVHHTLICQRSVSCYFTLLEAVDHFPASLQRNELGDFGMTTPCEAPDWRTMGREALDRGLDNGAAVAGSAEIVAGWEKRSAELRRRFGGHLDLRYG